MQYAERKPLFLGKHKPLAEVQNLENAGNVRDSDIGFRFLW
jgi:hypothetical protein